MLLQEILMGMPVKLSDELVEQAREEALAAERSITAQIEHWAQLGRSVESALRHDDVLALKRARGDMNAAFPRATSRRAIQTLLRNITEEVDRKSLARKIARGRVVYQADPKGSGLIERIEPGGVRTLGRFENRQFVVADRPKRRS
jgi:ParD-like antitoxin of type II bacterial toxin-antitoxin system